MFESSPAVIINKFGIKEADLILTLLTKNYGKIKAVLHGARGTSRRFSGNPDIFDCGIIELTPPRSNSNLYTVHSFSRKVVWQTLRKDISRFALASFCLEASDVFSLEGEPETVNFFNPLYHALNNLNKEELSSTQCNCAVIFFFLTILKTAGYNPVNAVCHSGSSLPTIEPHLEADVKLWLSNMLDFNAPILFDSQPLIIATFSFLVGFAETVLEKRLKTTPDLFLALT